MLNNAIVYVLYSILNVPLVIPCGLLYQHDPLYTDYIILWLFTDLWTICANLPETDKSIALTGSMAPLSNYLIQNDMHIMGLIRLLLLLYIMQCASLSIIISITFLVWVFEKGIQ